MTTEKLLKAVANRRRLAVLKTLDRNKEMTVIEIAHQIKLSFKATSKHLLILFHADVLERRQIGLQVFYFLAEPLHPLIRKLLTYL